jgi:hypothetical protein
MEKGQFAANQLEPPNLMMSWTAMRILRLMHKEVENDDPPLYLKVIYLSPVIQVYCRNIISFPLPIDNRSKFKSYRASTTVCQQDYNGIFNSIGV